MQQAQKTVLVNTDPRADYPETAVRLQQEWNVENPQALDFAPHVGQHTLVAVLQRGLIYHRAEREFLQVSALRDRQKW